MARRLLAAVAAIGLLLLGAGPVRAQDAPTALTIRDVDIEAFPVVTMTVSVEGDTEVDLATVQLTENARQVSAPAVRPLTAAGGQIGVVLVIDTSGSMAGGPIASAIAAARQFLESAGPEVSVGVVTFSDSPRVAAQISTNRSTALRAVSGLQATGETALNDAVVSASRLFSGQVQKNIILLSDGADTASSRSLNDAVAAARRADATIFSIGLRGSEIDISALRRLARTTNGQYVAAAEADLSAVYDQILTSLTQQFVVTYRSDVEPGGEIDLTVTAPVGSDSISFLAPPTTATPTAPPSPQVKEAVPPGLFSSTWAMTVVLIVVFFAAFVMLMMLLGPAAQVRRERDIRRRVGRATLEPEEERGETGLSSWLPTLVAAGDRLAHAGGFTLRLEHMLERAGLPVTPGEIVAGSFILLIVGAVVGAVGIGGPLFGVIGGAAGALLPLGYIAFRSRQRVKKLHEQLPDVLMILASSLRAGHSFMQAIDTVSKEVPEPAAKEFSRVVTEIRLGRPVEEALNAMAERIGSEDMKWAVLAVNIQRDVGGNLAEVLDTVAETIRDRDQIRRQVEVLSIEGKLSMYILIGLPIAIGLYIYRFNKSYIGKLFESTSGWIMFGVGAGLMVIGYLWMRKIVKIDV